MDPLDCSPYFKKGFPEILSNIFKNKTPEVTEIFSKTISKKNLKKLRWTPRQVFQKFLQKENNSKQFEKKIINGTKILSTFSKIKTQELRRSFQIFSKTKHKGHQGLFRIFQKIRLTKLIVLRSFQNSRKKTQDSSKFFQKQNKNSQNRFNFKN